MIFTRYVHHLPTTQKEHGGRFSGVWHGMGHAPHPTHHPPRTPRTNRLRVCATATQDDLYQALGITRNATKAQIKAAYRRAVRDCHPDINPSLTAAQRFKVCSFG